MLIRPMLSTDLSAVFQLGTTLFREEDEVPDLRIALRSYDPTRSFVTCCSTDDAEITGFAIVRCYSAGCYELAFLGVSPHYHGRGIGSRLLRTVLDTLAPTDFCWLLVDVDNRVARAMYEKVGFQLLETCEGRYSCFRLRYLPPSSSCKKEKALPPTPANAIAPVG